MDEKALLKPVYLKGGRDLKGVETTMQFYGTRDYLRSIGIEPLYFIINKDIISEVTEQRALKIVKEIEEDKNKAQKKAQEKE